MKASFIGQGYNPNIDTSVANSLIDLLSSNEYSSFRCLVAFASRAGVSALSSHINSSKKHIKDYQIIVGVDQEGTSEEALREVLEWGVPSYIYYTSQRIIFHPKIYLFEGNTKCTLIVGSNNLTLTGLAQNIESSVQIDFDKTEEEGAKLLNDFNNYFESIFLLKDVNLKPITKELIAQLIEIGLVPTEKQRRQLYAKGSNHEKTERDSKKTLESLFEKIKVQPLPEGFAPTKKERASEAIAATVAETLETAIDDVHITSTFLMTLQRTDVGVGQTTSGTSRRSPEIFIPLSARKYSPDFWGWDDKFTEDGRKPGKFDRVGVNMKIGTDIYPVNMMTWPDKSDFRLRSEALRSAGKINDILKIEVSSAVDYEYVVYIISKGDKDYDDMLTKCNNSTRNSKKMWGYY